MVSTANPSAIFDESIRWHNVLYRMPDADETVLVWAPMVDEPVWLGFYDGEQWVTDGLTPYPADAVKAWASLPAGPGARI